MFSYRHSFHAGNHADVLKHLVQLCILDKLQNKQKPAIYIDTHSGAGLYDLAGEEAQKTKESASGIQLLLAKQHQHRLIKAYLDLVAGSNGANTYPGSPWIAARKLRQQDQLILIENHNTEIDNLKSNFRHGHHDPKIAIHHRDGYEALLALLPPAIKRGLVLIDPSYEVAGEYQKVCEALTSAVKKWSTGIFAIWYPLLGKRATNKSGLSEKMVSSLAQLPVKNLLDVRLQVASNDEDAGMFGSGMLIVNPPWQLDEELNDVLSELATVLRIGEYQTHFSINWLIQDN